MCKEFLSDIIWTLCWFQKNAMILLQILWWNGESYLKLTRSSSKQLYLWIVIIFFACLVKISTNLSTFIVNLMFVLLLPRFPSPPIATAHYDQNCQLSKNCPKIMFVFFNQNTLNVIQTDNKCHFLVINLLRFSVP